MLEADAGLSINEAFDALDVGVFIANNDLEIIYINSYFEKLTTIRREELLGQNVQYLLDKGYISKSICQLIARHHKPEQCLTKFKNVARDVVVTGKPVFTDQGELQYIICTLRDSQELSSLYSELQQAKAESAQCKAQLQLINKEQFHVDQIIAKDKKSLAMVQLASQIARTNSTVLILGESGVGKDQIAKCMHSHSLRPDGNFVHVNCGAIPETLFEAEFFGYGPGAFTGAAKNGKIGLIETAHKGTLFLDEIAELPLLMQVKLLKVLQSKTMTRVGETKERHVDVRVIAATNKNLSSLVAEGKFREDLFYRLNVLPLTIPPLRERKDDIPHLIYYFVKKLNIQYEQRKYVSPEVVDTLVNYPWPGNVRELENFIERLVVLCPDNIIETKHLPHSLSEGVLVSEAVKLSGSVPLKEIVAKLEKAIILNSINKTDTLQDTAELLGIDLSTLTRKKQKYGIFKKCAVAHN